MCIVPINDGTDNWKQLKLVFWLFFFSGYITVLLKSCPVKLGQQLGIWLNPFVAFCLHLYSIWCCADGKRLCCFRINVAPSDNLSNRDFPGGPVGRTQCFHSWGPRFDPRLGNQDPKSNLMWPKIVTKNNPSSSMGSSTPKTLKFHWLLWSVYMVFLNHPLGGWFSQRKPKVWKGQWSALKLAWLRVFRVLCKGKVRRHISVSLI